MSDISQVVHVVDIFTFWMDISEIIRVKTLPRFTLTPFSSTSRKGNNSNANG
jgi:hypothetical protein